MIPSLVDCAVALSPAAATGDICEALGMSRATFYRALSNRNVTHPGEGSPIEGSPIAVGPCLWRSSPRALSLEERENVLGILNSERYADMAPPQVYTGLLDQGQYVASVSTMYRVLREHDEVRERRNQRTHPVYTRPEMMATGPNEVWSWDITKLRGALKGVYYCLYVILDIFSRYVVGWTIQQFESQEIAGELIAQTCEKQSVESGRLTIHADRGSAMTSKTVAELMMDLGVIKSHSRPHVSNDNPFSEAQFKTMKYRPDYPDRFSCIAEARVFCEAFFAWYNTRHYHSGIAMLTPQSVHYGRAVSVIEARTLVLASAHALHPERFVRKQPVPQALPSAVWINPPLPSGNVNNGTK